MGSERGRASRRKLNNFFIYFTNFELFFQSFYSSLREANDHDAILPGCACCLALSSLPLAVLNLLLPHILNVLRLDGIPDLARLALKELWLLRALCMFDVRLKPLKGSAGASNLRASSRVGFSSRQQLSPCFACFLCTRCCAFRCGVSERGLVKLLRKAEVAKARYSGSLGRSWSPSRRGGRRRER